MARYTKKTQIIFFDGGYHGQNIGTMLKILSEATNGPLLIATSRFTADKQTESLQNGVDFYGSYHRTDQNINVMLAAINRISEQTRRRKILTYLGS